MDNRDCKSSASSGHMVVVVEPRVEKISEEECGHGEGSLDQLVMLPMGMKVKHSGAKIRCLLSQA